MYCVKKVTEDLFWVGGNDRRLALFENVYPIFRSNSSIFTSSFSYYIIYYFAIFSSYL